MVHHPGGDDRVVAGEGAGDVLGALAGAEADLFLLDVDRVGAELDRGHLGRVAGARARLLEDQSDALAGERRGRDRSRSDKSQDLGEGAAAADRRC